MENYTVFIKLALHNEVSKGLLLMGGQFSTLNKQADLFAAKMKSIKITGMIGAGLFAGGVGLAFPFVEAITKAADLQKEMIGIQLATRGTVEQMAQMRQSIEKVSSQTIFSNIDVAKMSKLIATGTGLSAPQVSSLTPEYAKFADVQMLMKGSNYEESVKDAIRLAHTAGHYDASSLRKYLDLLTKATMIIPGDLSELGHALKYSQGMAKGALGINDNNMVLITALLNRLGFAGSRGGTNLLAAITRTIPGVFGSGLLTGKSGEALKAMDMVDRKGHSRFLKSGNFDMFAWMRGLSEYVQREFAKNAPGIARQHIQINFQHAFGVQGSRVASLLGTPQAIEQLKLIGESFQQFDSTDTMQSTFANSSVYQEFYNAKTNFSNVLVELGYSILPIVSENLNKLNAFLSTTASWISKNQATAKELLKVFLGLSAAMVFGGTVLLLSAAFRGLALALSVLRVPLMAMLALSAPVLGITAAFGLLVFGAYKLWQILKTVNWSALFNAISDAIMNFVNKIAKGFSAIVGAASKQVGSDFGKFNLENTIKKGLPQAIQVNSNLNINSNGVRTIANATTNHIVNSANSVPNNTSRFDPGMSPTPVLVGNF